MGKIFLHKKLMREVRGSIFFTALIIDVFLGRNTTFQYYTYSYVQLQDYDRYKKLANKSEGGTLIEGILGVG
jgi:hypothetical protein